MQELYQSLELIYKSGLYASYTKAFQFVDSSNLSRVEALNLNIYQGE